MIKKLTYLVLVVILIFIILNLSPLNIPSDTSRYAKTKAYFSEAQQNFDLASYHQNDIGMGMITYHNEMTLFKDVQPAYNCLIDEIEKAEKNINMEFYIIREDKTGNHFKHALIKKAREGIEIRVIYDAWGSAFTPRSYFNDLRKNGIKVAAYNPLILSTLQGRLPNRLHRKTIIIDGKTAFIGGENIGDEYLGEKKKIGFWKDTGILFRGEAVLAFQEIFLNDWLKSSHEKVLDKSFYPKTTGVSNNTVKIILGSPDSHKTNMSRPYIKLISEAKHEISIKSPYIFPNSAFLKALYQAAERSVNVHLILPSKNDNTIASITQPFFINQLLKHGIRVSTYNRGFIHSKTMIIDKNIASIGTANLDILGFSVNYEVISVIYDKKIINQLQNDFLNDLKYSTSQSL